MNKFFLEGRITLILHVTFPFPKSLFRPLGWRKFQGDFLWLSIREGKKKGSCWIEKDLKGFSWQVGGGFLKQKPLLVIWFVVCLEKQKRG